MRSPFARLFDFWGVIRWWLLPGAPVAVAVLLMVLGRGHATMAVISPQDAETPAEVLEQAPQIPVFPDIRVEVNIPATEMTVFEDGTPVFVKPIAIGSGVYPTPEQESEITRIEWNPWWLPPPSKWAAGKKPHPPGRGNPLGRVKMPISHAILFHGTDKEWTVGRPASHGCMRMYNADAEEVAWYFQEKLSQKGDPALKELYGKKSGTTFVVHLDAPVPVRLAYRPVVVRDDLLIMYPDYYGRLRHNRKAAVIEQLLLNNIALEMVDDEKIAALVKKWPSKVIETPISALLLTAEGEVAPDASSEEAASNAGDTAARIGRETRD